ncbi:FAD-dependent monooxygenase [Spongiactinospora sp. 9N601]|uniref:FAD-dependent monooxygenase n=1 Tax=Spongiactinospora sp. 9N601 TaxID=3375149 RepID=UPI0037AC7797
MSDQRVPVLIVGAGLSGLSTATFLGLHGVPALVVERHPTTSQHPKAYGQYPHVMEALRLAGLEQRYLEASVLQNVRIMIGVSMAGPIFHTIDEALWPDLSALTTAAWGGAGQDRSEPILADRARELGATIRFSTEVVSFEQDDEGVTVVLRDIPSGERSTVRADYLVAADGHRGGIRGKLGIGGHGRGLLHRLMDVHFEADVPAELPASGHVLMHLQNPELPGGYGDLGNPEQLNRYLFGVRLDDQTQPEDLTEERWLELIRTAVGVPDLPVKLTRRGEEPVEIRHWIADRIRDGRVFLVGDAVRIVPPNGGFGGNTAVMDGFYLGWKLAMVVKGQAGPKLLDSYEPERYPYAETIAAHGLAAFLRAEGQELGEDAMQTDPDPVSQLYFGYRHVSDAIVREPDDDGAPMENPEQPTGRPGSRAPHVPLVKDGADISSIELLGTSFVLLTGAEGEPWAGVAAQAAAELGIELPVHRIGGDGGLTDPANTWAKTYGVTESGATLVRPDFYIAWRSRDASGTGELTGALRAVLDR